ncbi:MAG: FkbM family methyltransferase [Bacteroidales bacterium]|nr:FkbM family methyltransferase [Bacteroidales bacterium]MBN2756758.1 FkbM family methyltransferase [Bacteroidales bacterium]
MQKNKYSEIIYKLLRLLKVIRGKDIFICKDINIDTETFGNKCVEWTFYSKTIDENSVVYSFGVGDDISFDLSLINKYDLQIFAFDPTPKSFDWITSQNLPNQFVINNIGLADYDGKAKFNPPENPEHISATMLERPETKNQSYKVDVKTLKSIMKELNHSEIDILKMDIEGMEYRVIDNLLENNILPYQILIEFHHRFKNVGIKETAKTVKKLRKSGYKVFHVSKTGEEIAFIRKDKI